MSNLVGLSRRDFLKYGSVAASGLLPGMPGTATVEPKPITDLLANPGMGWQTFHQFADSDRALDGLPSSSAYFRFYWREIEPRPGEVDFPKLDDAFARAQKAGQLVAMRLMCTGSDEYNDTPPWLKETGCRGTDYRNGSDPTRHWAPDWEDPVFLKAHLRTIAALGTRYDGHPGMDLLDIGTVGLWGEWHMGGTVRLEGGGEVPMPTRDTKLTIIDSWRTAFPKSAKVMLIGDEEGLRHAVKSRCGWRADCLGDKGGFSKNWNHMDHFYLQQLEKCGANDAWKTAPVAFESCWTMKKWVDEKWDVRGIFDYALRCHASYINNKSDRIPDGFQPEVERLLRKLGYRIVLKRAVFPQTVRRGEVLRVTMEWENTGVAPPYRDFRVAFRLLPEKLPTGPGTVCRSTTSILGWLPGTRSTPVSVALPAQHPVGRFHLLAALVEPVSLTPVVRLAIEGRRPDGWYPLGMITVA